MKEPTELVEELRLLTGANNFVLAADELVASWHAAGVGAECVEPVMRFFEKQLPLEADGMFTLIHYIEHVGGVDYDKVLLASIRRKPTKPTVLLLNRLINGTRLSGEGARLIAEMERAGGHPLTDERTREAAEGFLRRLRG